MDPNMTDTAELTLLKLHGLGNDFLVVLDDGTGPETGPEFSDLARRLCDRHTGIGADGLILGRPLDGPDGVLGFRLWNADGGEAEMSGNGIRCLAHAALDAGWVVEGDSFGVITPAGRRTVSIRRVAPCETWAEVDMGTVKIRGEDQRCNVRHGQLLVDVGNPHLVVLGPDPAGVDLPSLGPRLGATDPAGLNVEFVALGPRADTVTMRVWERGVGETLACGTGSVAAAAALHHWGRVGTSVTVEQPGGAAVVSLRDDGTATLAGPSTLIAECRVAR
jgi:diaminopimelate epimerase